MVQRFEQFTSAIFEISRCWHKLAEEELSDETREANPLYPVPKLMDRAELERFYELAADWS